MNIPAFVVASVALVAIPGPNLVYILTRSAVQGRRAGIVSALGVETATLMYVAATIAGLSTVVTAFPVAFAIVRYAGAGYLLYLAWRALTQPDDLNPPAEAEPRPLRLVYLDGLAVNLLNPKVALFFLAFFPQFLPGIGATWQHLAILGTVFTTVALAFDLAYALLGGTLRGWLRRGSGRVRYAVGGIYAALACYAALSG